MASDFTNKSFLYLVNYVLDVEQAQSVDQDEEIVLSLIKSIAQQEEVKARLSKYSYSDNRLNAVEKTLGAISNAFVFQIGLAQFEPPESQLVSTG